MKEEPSQPASSSQANTNKPEAGAKVPTKILDTLDTAERAHLITLVGSSFALQEIEDLLQDAKLDEAIKHCSQLIFKYFLVIRAFAAQEDVDASKLFDEVCNLLQNGRTSK